MCTIIDYVWTGIVSERFEKSKTLKFYKVVDNYSSELKGPFQDYYYNKGINVAEGEIDKQDNEIWQGVFHCFRTKKEALTFATCSNDVVIPIYCDKEDFVAAGLNAVCFTKITIRSSDYNKAMKAKNKYGVVGR